MIGSPLSELRSRGLVEQASDISEQEKHFSGRTRVLYCGFDPTADSLHIGNLVPLLMLRRFQLAGHRPIAVIGGATGLIGDPSGKSDERQLNDPRLVADWLVRIKAQIGRIIDLEKGPHGGLVVNNLEWIQTLSVMDFLRDTGKHFSVNSMIRKESVRVRLERKDSGISYTEFSYMILQALDYLELARRHDCSLQIGGSDQWGNITAGVDLVRRVLQRKVFALTMPLVTKADGSKFGKTESGDTPWLDPAKTSPYKFYQFWINCSDADVPLLLGCFTMLSAQECADLEARQRRSPEKRFAQLELACSMTRLVHGEQALESAQRISTALFKGEPSSLTREDLGQLIQDGLPGVVLDSPQRRILTVLTELGLAKSSNAVRDALDKKAILVNNASIQDPGVIFADVPPLHGRYVLLRFGKRNWGIVDMGNPV